LKSAIRGYIIGKYGVGIDYISLKNARSKLLELKNNRTLGINISNIGNGVTTVNDLVDLYYKKTVLGGASPHLHPEKTKQIIDSIIKPQIGEVKLQVFERSPATVSRVIQGMIDRGVYAHAGTVLSILKRMSTYGAIHGHLNNNPTLGLSKGSFNIVIKPRDRALDYVKDTDTIDKKYTEIRGLINTVNLMPKMSVQLKLSIVILILTGVRKGELKDAKWCDIDLDTGKWLIPKALSNTSRKGSTWQVPLTPLLCSLFRQLKAISTCDYATGIEGKQHSDRVLNKAIERILKLRNPETNELVLDIEPITPHTIRHTFRTHIENLDVPPHVAEKCLNHSLGGVMAVYNKNPYFEERREALNKWSDFISNLAPIVNDMGVWKDEN